MLLRVPYYLHFPTFSDNISMNIIWPWWSNQPYCQKHRRISWLFVPHWLPESGLHLQNILPIRRRRKVSLQKLPEAKPSRCEQYGSNNFATMQTFSSLPLLIYYVNSGNCNFATHAIYLYSKHSSTSSSWITDWSLSNLSTWTKVVCDPWTKRPKSTLH